jgi:hypothetical protein
VFALFIFSGIIAVIAVASRLHVSDPDPALVHRRLPRARGARADPVHYTFFELAGFTSLIPYWSERDPVLYQFQSLYLYVTAVFFSIFFSERTHERAELCLKAYAVGARRGRHNQRAHPTSSRRRPIPVKSSHART